MRLSKPTYGLPPSLRDRIHVVFKEQDSHYLNSIRPIHSWCIYNAKQCSVNTRACTSICFKSNFRLLQDSYVVPEDRLFIVFATSYWITSWNAQFSQVRQETQHVQEHWCAVWKPILGLDQYLYSISHIFCTLSCWTVSWFYSLCYQLIAVSLIFNWMTGMCWRSIELRFGLSSQFFPTLKNVFAIQLPTGDTSAASKKKQIRIRIW